MANSSATYNEGTNKQPYNSISPTYNGGSMHGELGVPAFQHQKTISMAWTSQEHLLLVEGFAKYAKEPILICYAKIAAELKNKTVRDVALRGRWITRKEIGKTQIEDVNVRKRKDRKEKSIASSAKPSRLSIQSGIIANCNDKSIPYDDINGATRQLLEQNAFAFKQISKNLCTHQIHENIELLSQARDNICKILTSMKDMAVVPPMKRMPPLPKLNEELARSILPPPNLPIQL